MKRLAWPALSWFFVFIFLPLAIVFFVSFQQRGTYGGIEYNLNLQNYIRVFDANYLYIFFSSLRLALLTAVSCVFVALPMAWAMVTVSSKLRKILFTLIALPFLTNLIIRVYAIKVFVGANGPLQFILDTLHINYDPFLLTSNTVLVAYGLFVSYLPFAVLPLYSAFEKFDFVLLEAAQDLGADQFKIFLQVIIPQLKSAIQVAFILVFIPALGEYVIPDLLGGAKTMLIGNFIAEEFLKARDWPFGAAISFVLIFLLFIIAGILSKHKKEQVHHE